jgi:hypothetical protein
MPRSRIGEILVLASPEAVAAHHDPATENGVVGIKRRQRAAFFRGQQSLQDGATLRIEIAFGLRPVDLSHARGDIGFETSFDIFCGCFHGGDARKSGPMEPPDFRQSFAIGGALLSHGERVGGTVYR